MKSYDDVADWRYEAVVDEARQLADQLRLRMRTEGFELRGCSVDAVLRAELGALPPRLDQAVRAQFDLEPKMTTQVFLAVCARDCAVEAVVQAGDAAAILIGTDFDAWAGSVHMPLHGDYEHLREVFRATFDRAPSHEDEHLFKQLYLRTFFDEAPAIAQVA